MFSFLPWELNQLIIDNLYDRKETLLSICLVCKHAVPFARRHLFYRLHGRFKKELGSGGVRIAGSGADQEDEQTSRLYLVLRGTLKVGDYVRSISLENPSYNWFRTSGALLQRVFPNLREVRISNASWNVLPPLFLHHQRSTIASGRLKGVRSVVMVGTIWSEIEHLERFLTMFPDCDALTIRRSTIGSEQVSTYTGFNNRLPSGFHKLTLDDTDKFSILKWIQLKSHPSSRLTTLTLRKLSTKESAVVGELLKSLEDALSYLDISFKVDGEVMASAGKFDLSRNTELDTLIFDDWSMSGWVPREWSLSILRTIRSKRLTTLQFSYRVSDPILLPLAELAPFLNAMPFPNVKTVQFVNRQPFINEKRERSELMNRLPGLVVKGVFQHAAEPKDITTESFLDRYYLDT
ncbi:hypothetical protein FRC14_007251 [Serendipita sp. 396]|nr:hypothetical protein FRC14_007251 [Serendipita sp. 396]KAG8786611.1 hypothetical protein FRC15_011087 [Serendipita sp. 397]KAG8836792.1 hypothetical protein FRC18_010747 [Serendipita sp. 400]KAG8870994.1 hypothetical protein FRC20_011030 [Serendipita sp. 405]KAG9053528.1 hypothetical protein FS842_007929 [Serendipita sp. 407]